LGLLRLVPSEAKESPAFAMTGFFEIAMVRSQLQAYVEWGMVNGKYCYNAKLLKNKKIVNG